MEHEIINKVKGAITHATHIDMHETPLRIDLEGDAVVVEGEVERVAHKKRALKAAMEAAEGMGIIDRIRVIPARHMGDDEIERHIYDGLEEEATIDAGTIEVNVKEGIVDLEGRVHSLIQKRIAGLIAWWVPGVRDVVNSLEVDPPEEDSDAEVMEAVRLALEKDNIVDHGAITVEVKNWVVTLGGTVKDDIEKEAAEDDAWYIWGVDDVVNRIEVVS